MEPMEAYLTYIGIECFPDVATTRNWNFDLLEMDAGGEVDDLNDFTQDILIN